MQRDVPVIDFIQLTNGMLHNNLAVIYTPLKQVQQKLNIMKVCKRTVALDGIRFS